MGLTGALVVVSLVATARRTFGSGPPGRSRAAGLCVGRHLVKERHGDGDPSLLVWLVNPFDPIPGEEEQLRRYAYLAASLREAGHRVVWWSSDFSHRFKRPVDKTAVERAAKALGIVVRSFPPRPTRAISRSPSAVPRSIMQSSISAPTAMSCSGSWHRERAVTDGLAGGDVGLEPGSHRYHSMHSA
jgi:hypothetical protein